MMAGDQTNGKWFPWNSYFILFVNFESKASDTQEVP